LRKIIAAVVVLGLVAAGIAGMKRLDIAHARQASTNQEVVRVIRRDVGTRVKATGVIKPMIGAEVNVGSSVSGVVMRLFVQIGDRVDKGQLLAELDSRTLKARRDADAAALQVAQANLDYAEVDLRRKRQLNEAQIISRSELDLASKAFAVAEQQRDQARATLADSTTQLGYTQVFAPIAGTVSGVSTQEGETVAASFATPTFVTLLDLSKLEVWAYVDETDIGHIRKGELARFTVDTYGEREFAGTVTSIHPKAEIRDNVVDYVVVVRFTAPREFVLRPEMTTTVNIDLDRHTHVLAVPVRAVRREGNRAFVLCRNNGKIEQRWVSPGIRDDGYWEVVAGLREGEEVVIGESNSH
jgi:RND family efflux transporter MFP subunit